MQHSALKLVKNKPFFCFPAVLFIFPLYNYAFPPPFFSLFAPPILIRFPFTFVLISIGYS